MEIFHTLQTCAEPEIVLQDEYRNNNQCTHQIINIGKLQKLINEQCISKCCFEERMNDFIRFCSQRDVDMPLQKLEKLRAEWKMKCEFET